MTAVPENEAEVIREMSAIDTSEDGIANLLKINPEVDTRYHSIIKDLFFSVYFNKERFELPRTGKELSLRLPNDNPIFFGQKRLSYVEKEKVQKFLDSESDRCGIIIPCH